MSVDIFQINPSLAVLGWFVMEAKAGWMEKSLFRKSNTTPSLFLPNYPLFPESNLHLSVFKMFLTRIKWQTNTATALPLTERWNGNFLFINVHLAS